MYQKVLKKFIFFFKNFLTVLEYYVKTKYTWILLQ